MSTNRYSAPFREEVQGWIVKLSTVSEIVEQWLMVQNMWVRPVPSRPRSWRDGRWRWWW